MTKYFLYARMSEEDSNRQVLSIDDQIKKLHTRYPDLDIVATYPEAHTANEPGRPLFNEMLERICDGEAQGILVWNLNRLLGNPVDQGTVEWMLWRSQILSILTMDKEHTPADTVLILSVESAVAKENKVTSRKQTQQRQEDAERLRVREERYALAVEGSQNGLWDVDVATGEMYVSPRWEQMIGYAEGQFPRHVEAWVAHLHPDDRARMEEMALAYYRRETDVYEAEFRLRHKDGSYRWILSRGVGRFDSEGKPQRMAGADMDITQRKQREEKLQAALAWQKELIDGHYLTQSRLSEANELLKILATTDDLTGLKNHCALQECLRHEYDRARYGNTPFSILRVDVDNFEHYKDTYGNTAGDSVLLHVVQILQETARTGDVVVRYGDEEFVVLLPEADGDEAKTVAERLRSAVETGTWPQRGITVSIGAATLAPTASHPDTLLADADAALYCSRHQGGNGVTHSLDIADVTGLDTQAAEWADALIQRLLAIQQAQAEKVSEQVQESLLHAYDATIMSWSRILDLKDKETEGSSEGVTKWLMRLMQYLGFNGEEMQIARWGACLHDIGTIAVPDHILLKPGPLTEEERAVIRQHTSLAHEMLEPLAFLGQARAIPHCHHEKWDGSGYPRGLKGAEIPLMARLFAVVDVYDALTSERPYRKAWTAERVKVYLKEQSGTHFDPRAVEAFLNMLLAETRWQ